MNLIRKILFLGWLLLILFLCINVQPTLAQGYFSDNFSGTSISTIWTVTSTPGINAIESAGVLSGHESSLSSNWGSVNLNKTIDGSVKNVSIDYSFNFKDGGMGRIYLIGRDLSNTKNIWYIGVSDGTTALNAKPVIDILNQDGGGNSVNLTSSWNFGGSISSVDTGGSGHVGVQFLSTNLIGVNFTFSKTNNGMTSKNGTFEVSSQTKTIDISFNYPPSQSYQSDECFMVDNYVENGPSQITPMSSHCLVTTNSNFLQSNPGVVSNQPTNIQPFSSDSLFFAVLGLCGIGVIAVITIMYIYKKKVNLTKGSTHQEINTLNNNPMELNKNLCVNCNSKIGPYDNYCQNCGTPIINIK